MKDKLYYPHDEQVKIIFDILADVIKVKNKPIFKNIFNEHCFVTYDEFIEYGKNRIKNPEQIFYSMLYITDKISTPSGNEEREKRDFEAYHTKIDNKEYIELEFDKTIYSKQIKDYWKYLNNIKLEFEKTDNIFCVNTKESWGFSKNVFLENYRDYGDWFEVNKHKDCYMNYNPLKTTDNRKNENVAYLTNVCLDIEFVKKSVPETDERLEKLKELIKKNIIRKHNIKNYMLVMSGNGYHLYMRLKEKIKATREIGMKYRIFIDEFQKNLEQEKGYEISIADRKDTAGILRIPMTRNIKANRIVIIHELKNREHNENLGKMITDIDLGKELKIEKIDYSIKNTEVTPTTYEGLMKHPFMRLWIENDTLPKNSKKHNTIIFALQILAKYSKVNLSNLKLLERYIEQKHYKHFIIDAWSENTSIESAYGVFINWCNIWGYDDLAKESSKLLKQILPKENKFKENFMNTLHDKEPNMIKKLAEYIGQTTCVHCGIDLTFYDDKNNFECKKCGDFGSMDKLMDNRDNKLKKIANENTNIDKKGDIK